MNMAKNFENSLLYVEKSYNCKNINSEVFIILSLIEIIDINYVSNGIKKT